MSRSRTPGIARIVILIGGTCAEMARFAKSLVADVVLWVDVLSELEKVKAAPDVIRLVLAAGHTLDTLFEGASADEHSHRIRNHLKSRPGVDLNTGLAQAPFAGLRAADLLIATAEFRAVLKQIFSDIQILHNGTIEKVECELYSSGCGGTGGPAGGPIVSEIARYYREHHRAVVHVRFNRAGSLSFEGLGDAVHANRAANVFADLTYILLDPRPLAEVRALNLFELPMVVKDKAARDRFMASLVQALNCPEYRALRDVAAPNVAAHNPLGSVDLLDTGWWHGLGSERIRCNVAARFSATLLQVLATPPARYPLDRVDVAVTTLAPIVGATIPELLSRIHQSRRAAPPGLIEAVEAVQGQFTSVSVGAVCDGNGRADFGAWWRERCRGPASTLFEFGTRLALLRSLMDMLDSAIVDNTEKVGRLQSAAGQTRSALSSVVVEYYPASLAGRLTNWLFAESRRRDRDRRFGSLARVARETKLALDQLATEARALATCRNELRQEVEATEHRLRSVLRILGDSPALARDAKKEDLVEIAGLDTVLQNLLRLAEAPELDEQLLADTLLGCAKRITISGLAMITGAVEPRVELIARKLTAEPPTVGPFWGGKRPLSVDSTVFVLPPAGSGLRSELESALAPLLRENDRLQFVFADSCDAGFNVLRLQIRHPKTFAEIVTPQIADEFDEIVVRPELYFPPGFNLEQLKPFVNGQSNLPPAPLVPR